MRLHSVAFNLAALVIVSSSWNHHQESSIFVGASELSFEETTNEQIISQRILRAGIRRIRGSVPVELVQEEVELPEEEEEIIRRLTAKGCAQKLSGSRGGAGGVAKCSETDISSTGPQIATRCTQVSAWNRLSGNGVVKEANNYDGDIIDPPCDRNFFGRGTWWSYIGTGERVVVSTCHSSTNISTALFLYQSSDLSCDSLSCFARSNINQCGAGGLDSFFAKKSTVYYLSVLGDNGNNRNVEGPEGLMAISMTRQANGCNSYVPKLDSRGKVIDATIDERSPWLGPQCTSNLNGRGLWYQFEGTGESMLISTCHNTTNIPTAISVYGTEQGTVNTCAGLTCHQFVPTSQDCVDANGQSKGSMTRLKVPEGLKYYVSIVGDNENNNNIYPQGPQGDVGVSLLREFNACDRDIAPLLTDDGSVVTASNMEAKGAPLLGPQCGQNFHGRGRWYQFWGKGEPVLISTCHSSTTIPTTLSVYEAVDDEASCEQSTCQAFEDANQCEDGNGSIILLSNATKDKTHYFSVLGSNGNLLYPPGPEGEIGIHVVTRSNGCDQATPMFDDGRLDIMNTADGASLGPQCDMQYNGRGYWYTFLGEGREVVASTCHPQTNISTVISVYKSSKGGCGDDLSCVAVSTSSDECTSGKGSLVKFLAEDGVIYKISVIGDNGNSLLPASDGEIAFNIATYVDCPCWSASELATVTPETMDGGYIAQSCNTKITGDLKSPAFPPYSATIQLVNDLGLGAKMTRFGWGEDRIECSITGSIGKTLGDLEDEDQINLCLDLLYNRCTEISSSDVAVELSAVDTLDVSFAEKCTRNDFVNTILISEVGAYYDDCLKVATEPPLESPTISCPCWTAEELESVTPTSLQYTDNSCNTEITGDLSVPSNPVNRASIRVVDETGLGARIVRLGADEDRTICTMAGSQIRSIISLTAEEVDACLILLHDRCEELSASGRVTSGFSSKCSILDFSDTIITSVDGSEYDNCLQL